MYPLPGHLSLSYVLAQALNLHLGICLVAGLFPDVFDKTLKYALHIYPYGRVIMHSLLGVVVTSLVVLLPKGKSWGLSWFVGHLFHPFASPYQYQ